jgi:hypothetical protein
VDGDLSTSHFEPILLHWEDGGKIWRLTVFLRLPKTYSVLGQKIGTAECLML